MPFFFDRAMIAAFSLLMPLVFALSKAQYYEPHSDAVL